MAQNLRILAVNAHPHDFTHYAGTLGIHASRGDQVTVVSVTTGANTHNERLHDEMMKPAEERDPEVMAQTEDDYVAVKGDELRAACAVFGISDVRILGFPQPFRIKLYPESIEALRDVILDVRPHVMITQSPYFKGPHSEVSGIPDDHDETAYASMEARGIASTARPGETVQPHTIAATYFPGVYFQPREFDFIVDISDWFDKRVEAEALYRSQGHYPAFARRRMEVSLGNTGWFAGTMYAEAFVREKAELVSKIEVPESALRRASEPIRDYYKRIIGETAEGD